MNWNYTRERKCVFHVTALIISPHIIYCPTFLTLVRGQLGAGEQCLSAWSRDCLTTLWTHSWSHFADSHHKENYTRISIRIVVLISLTPTDSWDSFSVHCLPMDCKCYYHEKNLVVLIHYQRRGLEISAKLLIFLITL